MHLSVSEINEQSERQSVAPSTTWNPILLDSSSYSSLKTKNGFISQILQHTRTFLRSRPRWMDWWLLSACFCNVYNTLRTFNNTTCIPKVLKWRFYHWSSLINYYSWTQIVGLLISWPRIAFSLEFSRIVDWLVMILKYSQVANKNTIGLTHYVLHHVNKTNLQITQEVFFRVFLELSTNYSITSVLIMIL